VRIPASLCGIVGLKPTAGRVSNHGTLRLSATLDTLGPMTRDVEDAALLFSIMHGPDSNDPETLTQPAADVFTDLRTGVGGLRLGVLPQHELGEVDPEVARAFAAALDVFRALGARTGELALPGSYKRFADLTGKLIAAEGYALHREWIGRDDLPFDREVRDRIRWAQALSADDYADILAQREQYRRAMARCWGNFDALLIPATPLPAIPLGEVDQSKSPMSLLTRPVNLLGLCALALPCGFTASGLPVSLQIAGRPYAEARVLQIGRAYENATPWRLRHPAETPAGGNSTR
jgi:aspartyl-tRNA(Asn)/glutamyl-tRNA(Gln) amidotransferase subunit A